MLSEANFLILDEPTNHLDITSKEILEQALKNYTGTVLYVSHDRYFINQTATRILELTGQTLINYIGNYDYYLEKKDLMNELYAGNTKLSGNADAGSSANPVKTSSFPAAGPGTSASQAGKAADPAACSDVKLDWKAHKEEQARIRKRQNDLKKTEDEIHRLETRDSEIDQLLLQEDVYTDVNRLVELNKEKEDLQQQLEALYERWEELAE